MPLDRPPRRARRSGAWITGERENQHTFFCDTVPLDRLANMHRHRRRGLGKPEPLVTPTGLDPLALIEDEHYRRTRLLTAAHDDNDDNDDPKET